MVKGLNAKTRLRVMKNIQKLRHITMPRPKTVDQFIADQISKNATQKIASFGGAAETLIDDSTVKMQDTFGSH